jgi:hypothetical protein
LYTEAITPNITLIFYYVFYPSLSHTNIKLIQKVASWVMSITPR